MDDCRFDYFSLPYIIILCIIPDFSSGLEEPKTSAKKQCSRVRFGGSKVIAGSLLPVDYNGS
jgi:hypothetical protein